MLKFILMFGLLFAEEPKSDPQNWYIYNTKENSCIKSNIKGVRISPADVINDFNCKVARWDFREGWVILDCRTNVKIKGVLFFSTSMEVCMRSMVGALEL